MQPHNDRVIRLAMRARGYNNCCGPKKSGEESFIKLLAKHRPALCIDIGANRGQYAESLLRLTDAEVISFEPHPNTDQRLCELRSAFPDRLVAVNKGVGDENAILDLLYGAVSGWATFSPEVNRIGFIGRNNKERMAVEVIRLDDFFSSEDEREIDLLKIDVEGYEYEVLQGARETIRTRSPKFIQIEFNLHQLFKGHSLLGLSSLLPGYRAYQILPHGLSWRDVKSPDANCYHLSNWVFVREGIEV
jgi:FkbM family methyltransferase